MNRILGFVFFIVLSFSCLGQDSPMMKANFLSNGAPSIDGDILNDPVWQSVDVISDLRQQQPNFGLPASEKTEIRLAFDDKNLYVSAVCFDSQPDNLVVRDARRDASLENTDAFLFVIDTYFDRQNGFMFGTNASGIEYDAQIDNDGEGNFNNNRQQGGVIGGVNLNWDASWTVATETGDYGWSAEFKIPLKTIRFKSGTDLSWGINFQRNITKTNELSFWNVLPLGFGLKRVSLAGQMDGLNLKKPGNLKAIPYVLASLNNTHDDDSDFDADFDAGLDIKYSLTPSMTLDLTYNTDFAQVEVDDQQVNLDRFNLFFPEKRPFFLENAGLFTIGSPGEVDLFFSRRIGISDGGFQVPIVGGARLSGKMNNTNIGLLNMYTDESALNLDRVAYTVARVNHEFIGSRSSLGGTFVNKYGLGESESRNSTFAVDAKYGIGQKATLEGFVAKTNTPGISAGDHAYKFGAEYQWDGWFVFGKYTEVGEGFNPEVGFLLRESFRKAEFLVFKTIRAPESSAFLENRPHISYRSYWDLNGFQETGFLHIDNHFVWKSLFEIHTGINFTKEGVKAPFNISSGVEVPAGDYNHAESQIVLITNSSKPVSVSFRSVNGGFFGGTRFAQSGTLSIRIGEKFTSEWSLQHNDINLPNGDFTADVFGSRLSYSFTPNIYLQSLIQHNSVTNSWASNVRFGWLQKSNSGLFVVFNRGSVNGELDNTSFIIKFSKLFDVIK